MTTLEELHETIIKGNMPLAKELTQRGLSEGTKPTEFIRDAIMPAEVIP